MKKEEIVEAISKMTVADLADLVKILEEKFGVSAAAPVAVAAPAASDTQTAKEEEQTEFTPMLVSPGQMKIKVIKAIREITSLSLKDAKTLVDNTANGPVPIKEKIPKEEADGVKQKLEEAGATVEIK